MIGKIANLAKKKYKNFKNSNAYEALKGIETLRKTKIILGKIAGKLFTYNFRMHGDEIAIHIVKIIGEKTKISSIAETGTFLGLTTSLFAELFPELQVYTCEINDINYRKAKRNLKKYANIKVLKSTSPVFLNYLIKNKLIGDKTFFYLDAHWLDDWPLEKEIEIITKKLKSAIIVIDDFKVPNDKRFRFDWYGNKECSLELVIPKMNKLNKYNILFPNYGEEAFSKDVYHPELIGYAIIFQNMPQEFKKILNDDFIKRFFVDGSYLLNEK